MVRPMPPRLEAQALEHEDEEREKKETQRQLRWEKSRKVGVENEEGDDES
jgi:hypothetical protein